jgi:hypothetical protein
MPINPNIALGAQQQQPVNMLGQMGQAMALRAASQDIQGNEALREFYASGGNAATPEGARALMAANPKMGMQILKNTAETQKIQGDALSKSFANAREGLSMVRTPEDVLNYSISQFSDPLIGPSLKARGLTPEAVAANLQKELSTSGFDAVLKKSAMGLDGWYKDQTSRRNQDVSSGASYGQLALAREKDARDVAQQEELAKLMRGGATQQTNALATAAAPTSDPYERINNLDTRIEQLMSTGNPKAIPIAQALNAQRTQLLASAKNQYGGQETTMEVTDPDTGQRTVVKARPDQYGRLVPVEMGGAPLSTDASATGGTTISPTVARPAPTAAVIKERQAVEKLPEAIAMNTDAIRKIDEMIGGVDAKGNPLPGAKGKPHPGFNGAVGFGLGAQYIPGTDARGFKARHEEVLSQAFLDAFEALKGGGAITEKEGEKATSARTRMNLATSEKEYMDAAREYQGVLKRGIENARSRMQRSGSTPPASPSAPSSIDALLDKYK